MEEKKAKQEEMDNANAMIKTSNSSSGGGDLLSDLANKLAMRRKGISGTQNQGAAPAQGSLSTLGKMSMMIPSLPDDQDDDHENQNDDDDDDWN